MKILYGIQGTGQGHISRARELLPQLSKHASVDIMLSGCESTPELDTPIKYQKYGVSLSYDCNGGISLLDTLLNFRPVRLVNDVHSLSINEYDLVISDYEPISAWSAKFAGIPSVTLSHQASFLSENTPRPNKKSVMAEMILQHFTPADHTIGFHFKCYDDFIKPPIVRSAIRQQNTRQNDHITVYLPAYHPQRLKQIFAPFSQVNWHIFSPFCQKDTQNGNFWIHPLSQHPFLESFASCKGIICGAGFETCAEAMFMGKKMLAVPIHNQYEQLCNAAALKKLGVMTLDTLYNKEKELWHWLENQQPVTMDEIADPEEIVRQVLDMDLPSASVANIHSPSTMNVA